MESVVNTIADIYGWFLNSMAQAACVAGWAILIAAGLGSIAMLVDLFVLGPKRFDRTNAAARPSDSVILIGQLAGISSVVGGVVLVFRDTAQWWQAALALGGGVALLAVLFAYSRLADSATRVAIWFVWIVVGIVGVVAAGLAYKQRNDSAIPYVLLCGASLAFVRSWFTLGRPEVVFDAEAQTVDRNAAVVHVALAGIAAAAVVGGVFKCFEDATESWLGAGVVAIVGVASIIGLRKAGESAAALRGSLGRSLGWVALLATAIVSFLPFDQDDVEALSFVVLLVGAGVASALFTRAASDEPDEEPPGADDADPDAADQATQRQLKVEHLGMVYELPDGGSVEALKDVSFTLEPGRLLTLLGPSGCGKTTLLNILAGFLAQTSGEVSLGGKPIKGPGQDRGMVFQKGALFEWLSVNDNVGFGARMNGRSRPASREAVQGLLETVGLKGFGDKAVYELSGGMQQRVALARCLANNPDVILMDEPLGALDALTREKMQSLVLNLWKETGKTIVLVTHSVEEALYLGDQMFVMAPRPGRIEKVYDLPFAERALTEDARTLKGSPEFVKTREEVLSLIWDMEEEIMGGHQ